MYILKTSSRGNHGLFIAFGRGRGRRQDESTNYKSLIGNYYCRKKLRDVFGFAEHQAKVTSGLGYKLTLKRNDDAAVSNKAPGLAHERSVFSSIYW